jgi:hypothetical protein
MTTTQPTFEQLLAQMPAPQTLEQMQAAVKEHPYRPYLVELPGRTVAVYQSSLSRALRDGDVELALLEDDAVPFGAKSIKLAEVTALEVLAPDNYAIVMESDSRTFSGRYSGKAGVFTTAEHFNFGRGYLMHWYEPNPAASDGLGEYHGIANAAYIQDIEPIAEGSAAQRKTTGLFVSIGSTQGIQKGFSLEDPPESRMGTVMMSEVAPEDAAALKKLLERTDNNVVLIGAIRQSTSAE